MTDKEITGKIFGKYMLIQGRCYNPTNKSYDNYGAKGVTMCSEWLNNFDTFRTWCLENGWYPGVTIDKDILCDRLGITPKIYSPDTCLLISRSENSTYANSQRVYRHVSQYTIEGEYVATYPSSAIAATAVSGIASNIGRCCNQLRRVANGFQWKFEDDPRAITAYNIDEYRFSKRVIQIDSHTGARIGVFDSVADAARSVNAVNGSTISAVCRGSLLPSGNPRVTAHGFCWEYFLG